MNVQLIDAQTDEHLWAETYDRELTTENLFSVQSNVARSIAQALHANLTAEEDRVLELGTGSGYQAAILAELVTKVLTIEIIEPLGKAAARRLAKLKYDNVEAIIGDGYYGWPEEAPFDAIVVTAAASHIPPPLLRQLKPGGIMIIPVGSRFMVQQLVLVEKDETGEMRTRQILPVRFVPLTGKH